MFGHLLNRLHEPRESRVERASSGRHVRWTALVVLSLVMVTVGLDTTILNFALPLPDQLGAEGSTLLWIDRAQSLASWSWTATVEIGLVGRDLLGQIPVSMPSLSSASASTALSIFRTW